MATTTASPSLGNALGTAARFVAALENDGVSREKFQQVIDDPVYREAIVSAFKYTRNWYDNLGVPAYTSEYGLRALIARFIDPELAGSAIKFYRDRSELKLLLAGLQPRDRAIIIVVYLQGREAMSFAEAARNFRVSQKRFRELERRAVQQLRQRYLAMGYGPRGVKNLEAI